MAQYVWQHDLKGERDRLRLMDLLDPSSRFPSPAHRRCGGLALPGNRRRQRFAVAVAGAARGPAGHVVATDIRPDLMEGISGGNLEVRGFDVVHDDPPDAPYDLVAIRALLHHLPERRAVVRRMARWLKPGGWLFVQEPDFYPTWTVEPPSQKHFWQQLIQWADSHQIDYYVGRKIPAWVQSRGLARCQLRRARHSL